MPEPKDERLADSLGWFSLGLGVAQLTMPGILNRLAGIEDDAGARLWQRIVGVRELGHFALIRVGRPRPALPVWTRVAGDFMDLMLLGAAWERKRAGTARLAMATADIAAITALDMYTARRLGKVSEFLHVKAAVTVKRPRQDVYAFWRSLENLPTFMNHLESVSRRGDGRTHWEVKAPAGAKVSWDAETIEERPGEAIAWRSLEGASVPNAGRVRFVDAPDGQGTEVHVEFDYENPGGKVGELVAKAFGEEPTQQTKDDLRRLKQVLEAGEVIRSEATPEGISAGRYLKQRPAQPLAEGSRA